MPTETTLPRRELPAIIKEPIPPGLEDLGGAFTELVSKRKATMRAAVQMRAAFGTAEREVEVAAEKDRHAFRDAALEGKQDPGRVHELAATAEVERLHREAEGATLAANASASALRRALAGEPGKALLGDLHSRIDQARARLAEHLEPVGDDLAEMAVLTAMLERTEGVRKNDGSHIPGGRGPDVGNLKPVHVNGDGNTPAHLVELLKEYDPRRER